MLLLVTITTVSSSLLSVSAGVSTMTLNVHLPFAASLVPTHLFGSVIEKLMPLLTLMLSTLASTPAVIVTSLLASVLIASLPNSTGDGVAITFGVEPDTLSVNPPALVSTLTVSVRLLAGSAGALKVTLNEHLALAASLLPLHTFGSDIE